MGHQQDLGIRLLDQTAEHGPLPDGHVPTVCARFLRGKRTQIDADPHPGRRMRAPVFRSTSRTQRKRGIQHGNHVAIDSLVMQIVDRALFARGNEAALAEMGRQGVEFRRAPAKRADRSSPDGIRDPLPHDAFAQRHHRPWQLASIFGVHIPPDGQD